MNTNILSQINEALVQGMDGLILSNGDRLTADHKPDSIEKVSDDQLPFLLFDIGRMAFAPWQFWQESVSWDANVTLKIKGEPGDVDAAILAVLVDMIAQTKRITGLPIDKDGKVIPYGADTRKLFDRDELTFLVERGAPYFKTISVRPSDGPYCTADLVMHLETVIDVDPRGPLPRAQVAILGVNAQEQGIAADTSLPDPQSIAVVADSDLRAWGGYDTPDPLNRRRPGRFVAGVAPRDVIKSLAVTPYSAALSAGTPTAQLAAIVTMANWSSSYVTPVVTWMSDTPGVATVDSNGLVTRVAAGSASISCTYQGAASNAVAITCT